MRNKRNWALELDGIPQCEGREKSWPFERCQRAGTIRSGDRRYCFFCHHGDSFDLDDPKVRAQLDVQIRQSIRTHNVQNCANREEQSRFVGLAKWWKKRAATFLAVMLAAVALSGCESNAPIDPNANATPANVLSSRNVKSGIGYDYHIVEFDYRGRHHAYILYRGGSGSGIAKIGEYEITEGRPQ